MEKTLHNLENKNLKNIIPSSADFKNLLQILSTKTEKGIEELREGKGFWSYQKWKKELN